MYNVNHWAAVVHTQVAAVKPLSAVASTAVRSTCQCHTLAHVLIYKEISIRERLWNTKTRSVQVNRDTRDADEIELAKAVSNFSKRNWSKLG